MTNSPKEARRKKSAMRLWTFEQSRAAIPYIASILRSIREHLIEGQTQQRRLAVLEGKPGRHDRATLIGQDEARKAAAELAPLHIVVRDPLQGVALVPFLYDEQLACFVYDLHDPAGL